MSRSITRGLPALLVATASSLAFTAPAIASHTAPAALTLTQISSDPYTDSQAQHATEVEPDTLSFGSTIVSAFQVGRVSGGGASNIGWATSTDSGQTWTHGFLPDTTANTGGPYGQVSDASVAYDAKDNVWMTSYLGISNSGNVDVELSRSTDGGLTWATRSRSPRQAPSTTRTGASATTTRPARTTATATPNTTTPTRATPSTCGPPPTVA